MAARKKQTRLPIWDTRMLLLMEHCIYSKKCSSKKEFCKSIGFLETSLKQVKGQLQSFRLEHIQKAALKYGINVNWIMGLDSQMKRKPAKSVLQQFRDAVTALAAES